MRKFLIALLVIIVLLIAVVYIFVPGKLKVSDTELIKCSGPATTRYLADQNRWEKWWPSDSGQAAMPDSFSFKGYTYKITKKVFGSIEISTSDKDGIYPCVINILSLKVDSTAVEWNYWFQTSSNPIKKIREYFRSQRIKGNMNQLLDHLRTFLEKEENVYGMNVQSAKVRDTVLIFTKTTTKSYPSLSEIYGLVNGLKNYISAQNARETNYPMLHVEMFDSSNYQVMVAIPVDRELKTTDVYETKRMVTGNILEAEIRGGPHTIRQSRIELENYRSDHQLISPAIPFELLVTDRIREPDTSKWVTRIYYPIF